MKRDPFRQVEVIYRRARKALDEKNSAQQDARTATVLAIRKVEQLLRSVAPLKGLPYFPNSSQRAVRVRYAVKHRVDPLTHGETVWVVRADGRFGMASLASDGVVCIRDLSDGDVQAEDLALALSIAEELLQRHAQLCEDRSDEYAKAKKMAEEICAIRQ